MVHKCRCRVAICSAALVLAAVPARAQVSPIRDAVPLASASTSAELLDATASRQASSFSGLFRATLSDFRQLPSRSNLLIVAFGSLAAGGIAPHDAGVSRSFSGSRTLAPVFSPGETLGSAAVQMATAVTTQIVGRVAGKPRVTALGADLVRAQIVTQTLTAGIKLSVRRGRPDGTQFSLPSGHASTTFATATVLQQHFGWKAGAPAYALATYVAASRVQARRHFLSDVALGATLGIVTGRSVTIGRGDARFAVRPSAVPGGAGVSVTLVGRR